MEKQKQRKKPQGWYRWAILAFFLLCLTVALWLSLYDKKEESSYLRGNCWGSSLQEVRKREGGPFTYDPTTGTLTLEVSDQPGLEGITATVHYTFEQERLVRGRLEISSAQFHKARPGADFRTELIHLLEKQFGSPKQKGNLNFPYYRWEMKKSRVELIFLSSEYVWIAYEPIEREA